MITELIMVLDTVTSLDIIIFFLWIEGILITIEIFESLLNDLKAFLWEIYGKYQ